MAAQVTEEWIIQAPQVTKRGCDKIRERRGGRRTARCPSAIQGIRE